VECGSSSLSNGNKTIPQWYGCKNKNTLKRTKIKSVNTDAVSMLKMKKPKIHQFEIIFTYSYYNHAIKLLSRCSTNFVAPPLLRASGIRFVKN
jgi:hypothetical protein